MEAKLEFKKKIKGTQKIVPLIVGAAEEVIEGRYNDGKFYPVVEDKTLSKEFSPKIGKIYLDVSTDKQYKWDGEEYKEVNDNNVYTKNETYNKQETNALVGAAENAIKVTYNELVTLRNNSQLVPGRFYRITDYENNSLVNFDGLTTHPFDIILLALTENKLAEEGWAAMHENIYDVTFSDEVKKCYLLEVEPDLYNLVDINTKIGVSDIPGEDLEINEDTKTIITNNIPSSVLTEENLKYNDFQNSNLSNWKLWYCLDNDKLNLSETSTNKGIIYRIEDSTGKICKLKWRELKTLRDSAALVAGAKYRIIDYVTTTVQENTRSAGHQFDIIVTALTEGKLSEEASAAMHENIYDVTFTDGVTKKCYIYLTNEFNYYNVVDIETLLGYHDVVVDVEMTIDEENKLAIMTENGYESTQLTDENLSYNYFQNSNLSVWKVWYSLDNDTDRFAWANAGSDYIEISVDGENKGKFYRAVANDTTLTVGGETYNLYAWRNTNLNSDDRYYTWQTENPTEDSVLRNVTGAQYSQDYTRIVKCNYIGRGVIYRLIDEFNNDIKYDFKNIQFSRILTDGVRDVDGEDTWCYTLNVWHENKCQDASIVGNTFKNDDNFINGVYDNKFGYVTACDIYVGGINTFAFVLGDNVVLTVNYDNEYFGIYCNIIGNANYNNTIGSGFNRNTIGDNFYNNIIGNSFDNNIIGNGFSSNTIGNSFSYNKINNDFSHNDINIAFKYNEIGQYCSYNKIDNYFEYNTICNHFQYNTIGKHFSSNTIGNNCNYNIIGTKAGTTTITKDFVRFIRIEDGVKYVNITTSATTSASLYLQNIIIGKGIAGTNNSRKTITHTTVNDAFQTTYLPTGSTTVNV